MEWSADGSRLFAVTTNAAGGEYWLHIIKPPAAQYDARFTGGLTHSPGQAVAGEPLAVRGRLEHDGPAPAGPLKVRATRTDAGGTHDLGTATVKADGTFTVLDEPDRLGEATYTISCLGDLTHRPATDITHTVTVGKASSVIALTAPDEATMSGGIEITRTFTAQGKPLGGSGGTQGRPRGPPRHRHALVGDRRRGRHLHHRRHPPHPPRRDLHGQLAGRRPARGIDGVSGGLRKTPGRRPPM
ncbi:hypothetical protein OG873_27400 [Streptomyces violaceus]|uniref:hypothetical protein n=1 Tax=Streptomyces violaceus TaxID=1936 RepID=UPI002E2919C8|nr:hypothetical protein [Streptomyces violaceus]